MNELFFSSITCSIVCYELDDDDKLVVKGKVNNSIKVRLLGGNGTDQLSAFDAEITCYHIVIIL